MVTRSETLRELIYQKLVKAEGKTISISEIYKFVNDNCNFDEQDLIPPNLYGKPVKEPRWKRNVRNVLKSESDKNNIIWKGRGLYSYYQLESSAFEPFSFNVVPKKTFFGLDKSKAHCFTIPKVNNLKLKEIYNLSEKKLQDNIHLIYKNKKFPAIIRLVIMDRSKTRKLAREDLPSREIIQLSWISFKETKNMIKKEFNYSFNIVSKGGNNEAEIAKFDITEEKNFRVSLIEKIPKIKLKKKKIKSITCNIPSSFVNRNIKLANDRGNGEAKLYIGSVKDKEIFDQFFNNWHPMNTYELNKVDLLLYLQDVELEFSKQSKYKAVSKKLYRKLFNKVERLEENRIDLTYYEDKSRYYLRGTSDAWKLIRQTCLPLITTLLIEVKSSNDDGPCDYVVRILRSDEERAPNPTSGMKTKSRKKKTLRKPKQTRIKPMPEDSRTITDDLKDRVWRRDQGMCQANYKLDSRLDKNTGEVCGSNENLEFDHIVPFSRGGKTTYRNLQLLCRTHNRIKSDKEI